MKELNICLSTDDNYAKYAATVILSAVQNKAADDNLVFHILYSNLTKESMDLISKNAEVVFHKVDNKIFEPYFNNGACSHITIPTLYRLSLPSILNNVSRVLYLDCDLLVLKSLDEFFSVKLDDNQYMACVSDYGNKFHMKRMKMQDDGSGYYFNAGVCLMDLDKMRRDNIERKFFDYLKNNYEKILFSDQDVLNIVLQGKTKRMDIKYNFISPFFYFSNDKDVTIAHFAGIKPWEVGFYNKYRELFWHYFMQIDYGNRKEQESLKKKIFFMHKQICQVLLYIKIYPFFYFKAKRIKDLMRIVRKEGY